MKLLTKAIEKTLPAYGAQEKVPLDDHVFYVEFFNPWNNWTWYACEYDPDTSTFFGYVMGEENEWGDFSLDELETLELYGGKAIERDLNFKPITFKQLLEEAL